ncbi:MAG: efflux RND transporter periplasmic adaptor subunit [Acidobacteriia bacterium]|nr:efflux RND transporter periplasmic adaptor subunit [Terriglobia bacterium]
MHAIKLSRIIGLLVVLAAVSAGIFYWMRPRPVAVVLRAVDQGRVARTLANTRAGSIKACRRSKLALPSGGQIAHIYVSKGDHVRQGQPLLELWNADLKANIRVLEEEINTARARQHEACTRADLSARDARRAERLFQDKLIAEELWDKVASEARALEATCAASRVEIDHSQARLNLARTQLVQTILTAPFAGRVGDITGELGEFTTPSPPGIPTPPAVDLIDDSCYYVSAPVDEIDAGSLRVGMPANVSIDAFPGTRFPGHVRRIADYVLEVEKQARTVEIEVQFTTPPDKGLVVGYSADIEITPEARDSAVRVPTQAILQNKSVLVYNPQTRKLESRTIQTGISNWEFTEVTAGLAPGEQVVMSLDRAGVKAGASVTVESAGAGPAR